MKIYGILLLLILALAPIVHAGAGDIPSIYISLVNQEPDPANAGDIVEIRLGIENLGGSAANDMVIELNPDYPLELVPGEDAAKKIGTLRAYQDEEDMRIVKYRLRIDKNAPTGSHDLDIYYYTEGATAKAQVILSIDVETGENAEIIHIDKSVLIPGKQESLKFTINNVGNAPLNDLTFYWENEDEIVLPVGSDNTKHIKSIDIGESAEVEYQVIADTNGDAGLYKLDLHLSYNDPSSGTTTTISTIAGIYVGGGTDFEVAFSDSSAGETSFSIANVGSNPANSVSVIIPNQEGWRVTGSNNVIIGNLNTGDYTVASFTLQQSSRGMGNIQNVSREIMGSRPNTPLTVQIAYTDTMGNRNTVEKDVEMTSQSTLTTAVTDATQVMNFQRRGMQQQSFWSKSKWYLIVLVVVIAGVFIYTRRKKNNNEGPKKGVSKKSIFRKR
ncbi:MAG: COG1361 S-layer family protein [Nanoarchaeota archaeon]|nr:COG1361 S-layer family protein [Nanoarchaeota archaeon]